jgi:nucleoid-associated protein YgaU
MSTIMTSTATATGAARLDRPSGVRLTRRGRAVVVVIALMAVFAVLALRSAPAASTDVVHHSRTKTVVVTPGDTLWDIARRVDPAADPRDVIAEIEDLNSLSSDGVLHVGQPLFVPAA